LKRLFVYPNEAESTALISGILPRRFLAKTHCQRLPTAPLTRDSADNRLSKTEYSGGAPASVTVYQQKKVPLEGPDKSE